MKYVLLLLLLCTTGLLHAQGKTAYGNNKATGRFKEVNGIKVYYETYGKGAPLLLIHGNGGSISAFEKNIPFLAQHYRVIAADSRAQGKTVDRSDSLSFEQMADDAAALLKALKVDSAYVLGWSDGGIIGLLMAMRYPNMVHRLMITGANLWPDSTALIPGLWKQMKAVADTAHPENYMGKQKNDWKLFELDYLQPHIQLSQLESIQCPTLVVGGDRDLISVEHTVLISQHIPNAFLWIVPASGHATLIEHRDAFNTTALQFFSGRLQQKK